MVVESQFQANETATNVADSTEALTQGQPNYRAPFKYVPEQGTDFSSQFLYGASVSVIRRLPSFCEDTDPPLKSLAFLVPYGYTSTPSSAEVELPQRRREALQPPDITRIQRGQDEQAQPNPESNNPWDFLGSQRTNVERQEEEEVDFSIAARALPRFDSGQINAATGELLTTLADIDAALETGEEEEETFDFGFTPSKLAINQPVFPEGESIFNATPRFANRTGRLAETIDITESSCGDYEDLGAFVFLFNPHQMDISQAVKYADADTWGDIAQGRSTQWQYNENLVISINDIEVQGLHFRRVVQPILDTAFNLVLNPSDNGFEPIVWSFIWGQRVIEPVVLEAVRVKETAWYKGRPVIAKLSLTMKKVPDWQINDGLNVIVFNELLQTQLNQDPNTAQPSNIDGDAANVADTIGRLFGGEFRCAGLKQCTQASQFQDQRKKFQENNQTPSASDKDKFAVLQACINTAEGVTDSGVFIEDPTKCVWDSCCQLLAALVQETVESGGRGSPEVNARCDEINVVGNGSLTQASADFLVDQINYVAGDLFEFSPDNIDLLIDGEQDTRENLMGIAMNEKLSAEADITADRAFFGLLPGEDTDIPNYIALLAFKLFPADSLTDLRITRAVDIFGLTGSARAQFQSLASESGLFSYMTQGARNTGLSTFSNKFKGIQGFSRTIEITTFFPADRSAAVNGELNRNNFSKLYFIPANEILLRAILNPTAGNRDQLLINTARVMGRYLDAIAAWQTPDGILNALNLKRCIGTAEGTISTEGDEPAKPGEKTDTRED